MGWSSIERLCTTGDLGRWWRHQQLGGSDALVRLAEILDAPVITKVMGNGAIPDTHHLSLGQMLPKRAAGEYLHSCDLMLAIGTRFTQLDTGEWTLRLPDEVVQIDLD